MNDEELVATLADLLYDHPVHYDRASLRVQAAHLLPVVRRVAEQRAAEELAPVLELADRYDRLQAETWNRQRAAISYDFDLIATQIRRAAKAAR